MVFGFNFSGGLSGIFPSSLFEEYKERQLTFHTFFENEAGMSQSVFAKML